MKQLEVLDVPESAMEILQTKGFSLSDRKNKFTITCEYSKETLNFRNEKEVSLWINNYLYNYFIREKYNLFINNELNLDDCLKYYKDVINFNQCFNKDELNYLIDEIEVYISKIINGYQKEINKRIRIEPFYFYLLDEEIYNKDYPKLYPKKSTRPFLLYKRELDSNILWLIPISRAPNKKYEKLLSNEKKAIIKYSIVKTNCYILIQNIIPVNEKYIKSRFLYNGIHIHIKNKEVMRNIHKKAERTLAMIKYDKYYFSSEIKKMYLSQSEK